MLPQIYRPRWYRSLDIMCAAVGVPVVQCHSRLAVMLLFLIAVIVVGHALCCLPPLLRPCVRSLHCIVASPLAATPQGAQALCLFHAEIERVKVPRGMLPTASRSLRQFHAETERVKVPSGWWWWQIRITLVDRGNTRANTLRHSGFVAVHWMSSTLDCDYQIQNQPYVDQSCNS